MGSACCTLKIWTTLAVFYSIVNFIIFTVADIFILLSIKTPDVFQINGTQSWTQFTEGFHELDDINTLIGLILARIGLRLLILICVPVLFIGNRWERRKYILPWEILVAIYVIVLISSSTYFLIIENKCGFLSEMGNWMVRNISDPDFETNVQWSRFAIFLDLMDGGAFLILWIVFVCCVHLRGLQIRYEKNQLKRLEQWDTDILTYRIPRARLNSLTGREDNTLELRSTRTPVYPSLGTNSTTTSYPPYYDNLAFKY